MPTPAFLHWIQTDLREANRLQFRGLSYKALKMTLLNRFLAKEGRWRQRIGALQIRGALREMEGGNPFPPHHSGGDLWFIASHSPTTAQPRQRVAGDGSMAAALDKTPLLTINPSKRTPMAKEKSDIGLIGLAVMGQNLALNIADHGFQISVYNRTTSRMESFVAAHPNTPGGIVGCAALEEFVESLTKPRKMIILVQAGAGIDAVIESLVPLLDSDDIIIDGGNAKWTEHHPPVKGN